MNIISGLFSDILPPIEKEPRKCSLTTLDSSVTLESCENVEKELTSHDDEQRECKHCRTCNLLGALQVIFSAPLFPNGFLTQAPGLDIKRNSAQQQSATRKLHRGKSSSYPEISSFHSRRNDKIRAKINNQESFQELWVERGFLFYTKQDTGQFSPNITQIKLASTVQVIKYIEACKITLYMEEKTGHLVFTNLEFEGANEMEEMFNQIKNVLGNGGKDFVIGKNSSAYYFTCVV